MIFGLFILLVVLIAFAEIGLAALIVLPMTAVVLTGFFSFFAMLGGVEGAGEVFVWCATISAAFFGVLYLVDRLGTR